MSSDLTEPDCSGFMLTRSCLLGDNGKTIPIELYLRKESDSDRLELPRPDTVKSDRDQVHHADSEALKKFELNGLAVARAICQEICDVCVPVPEPSKLGPATGPIEDFRIKLRSLGDREWAFVNLKLRHASGSATVESYSRAIEPESDESITVWSGSKTKLLSQDASVARPEDEIYSILARMILQESGLISRALNINSKCSNSHIATSRLRHTSMIGKELENMGFFHEYFASASLYVGDDRGANYLEYGTGYFVAPRVGADVVLTGRDGQKRIQVGRAWEACLREDSEGGVTTVGNTSTVLPGDQETILCGSYGDALSWAGMFTVRNSAVRENRSRENLPKPPMPVSYIGTLGQIRTCFCAEDKYGDSFRHVSQARPENAMILNAKFRGIAIRDAAIREFIKGRS